MNRKVVLSISALLLVFDIGFTTVVINSGERRAAATFAGVAAIAALVRDYTRPFPTLGGLQ